MKIERINENQIRCTLSKTDLLERHLKISELAYGSERAKELFRDMMEQANIDFGFDADDIPLMIEAIPTSRDSIVLVVTKVDSPEEFDERFSRFGIHAIDAEDFDYDFDYDLEDEDYEDDEDSAFLDSSDIVNCFEQLHELIQEAESRSNSDDAQFIPLSEALQAGKKKKRDRRKKKNENITDKMRVFSFVSLNPVMDAAHLIDSSYTGKNTLWKDNSANRYYLLMARGGAKSAFHTACAVVEEFGSEEPVTYATQDYFNEHYQIIIKDQALARLAEL